jgi:PAS domain S-box-containing protein
LAILGLAHVVVALVALADGPAHAGPRLRAGILADFPPLYVKGSQKPRGLAIDVLEQVAREVDFEVDYTVLKNWGEALQALRTEQVDIIPAIGYTPDRAREFAYSTFLETVPVSIFVRAKTADIASLDDLHGRPLTVIAGSAAWEALRERTDLKLVVHEAIEPAIFAVLAGEADAFVTPEWVMWKKIADIGVRGRFKVVGKPVLDLRRGFLVRKQWQQFITDKINPTLSRLVNSPRYLELHNKWYGTLPPFWTSGRILAAVAAVLASLGLVFYVVWSLTVSRVNRKLRRALDEQIEGQRDLREGEERYRTLFENAPVGVAVASREGELLFTNRPFRQLFGYDEIECTGRSVMTLHPESDETRHRAYFAAAELPPQVVMEGIACVRKDGSRLVCDLTVSPMQIAHTPVVVGFFVDVTEKHHMEAELRQQEKMAAIGQLAGGIAHDFNNQLTGILGFADLLSMELAGNPDLQDLATSIVTAVNRARDLNKQILAFARKGKVESRPLDLHQVLGEVVALLRHTIDKRIVVETHFDSRFPCVQGDAAQLQNAFLNLALNARDAMPTGGTLAIRTRDVAAGVQVSVADTGHGMATEVKARAFEPFFTTKETGKGTGMGLAAVYGTIRNHEGTVHLDSEPGKGTVVTVVLPVPRNPRQLSGERLRAPGTTDLRNLRVLVVDDEPPVREVVRRYLESAGAQVTLAVDGADAVEYLTRDPAAVDVVVLDLIMPRLDGRAAFERMRAIRPDLRVLLASGYSVEGQASDLINAGALGLLHKPFHREDLLAALRSLPLSAV